MRVRRTALEQLTRYLAALFRTKPHCGLDADYWHDIALPLDAYERRARDGRVGVEDGFAGNGEERLLFQNNAMRLPPAKPDPPLRVAITDVSHAMVDYAHRLGQ